MARKRRGDPVHGWLVIDKAPDITSAKVVNKARKILNAAKVGHSGTLDPMATGILPLAFGEATKTVSYMMDGSKEYRFTVCWGEARDTDDAEGEIIETSDHRPGSEEIEAALPEFIGEIDQIPPAFSAIKVDGERAYKLARQEKPVDLAPRKIFIERFELIECPDEAHAIFEVTSGKGAYIRGLARDLARKLGTVGHISSLRRTRVGPFKESDAISLDKLEELGHKGAAVDILRPVETALDDIPALALTEAQAEHLRHGRPVRVSGPGGLRFVDTDGLEEDVTVCAMTGDQLVALVRLDGDEIRPVRVLNL